jgi:glucosamine-6-phosphate deaminase
MIQKEFAKDNLRVLIFPNRQAMGEGAGRIAAAYMVDLLREKPEISVLFAAAPSQNETLAYLKRCKEIDWSRVNAFHMDEYIGLQPDHPAGFGNFLCRSLFDALPFRSVNLINGNAPDIQEETRRYAQLLHTHPLDLTLMGVGENGHIAFNDPPVADFNDPLTVKTVELEEACRRQQVNDGCFPQLSQVPTHAITVTIPAILRAGLLVCSVPGTTKAAAIQAMLEGEISTTCPASILRTHKNAFLFLDEAAAAAIQQPGDRI